MSDEESKKHYDVILWALRISCLWFWWILSCGLWWHVAWYKITDVGKLILDYMAHLWWWYSCRCNINLCLCL